MFDLIINPFATILLAFYSLFGDTVLSIIAFTVMIRMALMPLSVKQYNSMKAMQDLQPKVKDLQERYKNDREMLTQKQMELYRDNKINPLAGCLPLFVQLFVMIGLLNAIIATLAANPGQLLAFSDRLLWFKGLVRVLPMDNQFAWLNLAVPDPYLVLPLIVVATTYLQQKLLMPPPPSKKVDNPDDPSAQAAAMTRQMTTIMPIMFGFFALSYSSGLSIYIIAGNIIGILQQAALGRVDFRRLWSGDPLNEDQQAALEKYGRIRLEGISDTRDAETKYTSSQSDSRSKRVGRANARAKRVKIKAKN